MSLADRIAIDDCGCHFDRVTNITTAWCWRHDPERRPTREEIRQGREEDAELRADDRRLRN